MVMTLRVAAAGETGSCRFPEMKYPLAECENDSPEGYDRAKLMRALTTLSLENDVEMIQVGSGDPMAVMIVGATFLEEMHAQIGRECLVHPESKLGRVVHRPLASLRGVERKLEKGSVAFVKIRFTAAKADKAVRIRVGYSNPFGVPGRCEEYARDMAIMSVQVIEILAAEYARNGSKVTLRVEDDASCPGLVAAAREDAKRRRLAAKRIGCRNRVGDQCSPADFACELYCDGKCREADEI